MASEAKMAPVSDFNSGPNGTKIRRSLFKPRRKSKSQRKRANQTRIPIEEHVEVQPILEHSVSVEEYFAQGMEQWNRELAAIKAAEMEALARRPKTPSWIKLGDILSKQFCVQALISRATQTDWKWNTMAMRWRHARILESKYKRSFKLTKIISATGGQAAESMLAFVPSPTVRSPAPVPSSSSPLVPGSVSVSPAPPSIQPPGARESTSLDRPTSLSPRGAGSLTPVPPSSQPPGAPGTAPSPSLGVVAHPASARVSSTGSAVKIDLEHVKEEGSVLKSSASEVDDTLDKQEPDDEVERLAPRGSDDEECKESLETQEESVESKKEDKYKKGEAKKHKPAPVHHSRSPTSNPNRHDKAVDTMDLEFDPYDKFMIYTRVRGREQAFDQLHCARAFRVWHFRANYRKRKRESETEGNGDPQFQAEQLASQAG